MALAIELRCATSGRRTLKRFSLMSSHTSVHTICTVQVTSVRLLTLLSTLLCIGDVFLLFHQDLYSFA
jgi:hypothetical protein